MVYFENLLKKKNNNNYKYHVGRCINYVILFRQKVI